MFINSRQESEIEPVRCNVSRLCNGRDLEEIRTCAEMVAEKCFTGTSLHFLTSAVLAFVRSNNLSGDAADESLDD